MKKIVLFGIAAFVLFATMMTSALADSCFQEQANVSTPCGGLATGNYVIDGADLYVNYSKPVDATNNSAWYLNVDGCFDAVGQHLRNEFDPLVNTYPSIPTASQSCWNYDNTTLQFKLHIVPDSPPPAYELYCFDGSWQQIDDLYANCNTGTSSAIDWVNVTDGDNTTFWYDGGSFYFYEESMIWDIPAEPCEEDWNAQLSPCIDMRQIKTYTDQFACNTSEDLPPDNGTILSCGGGGGGGGGASVPLQQTVPITISAEQKSTSALGDFFNSIIDWVKRLFA